MLFLVSDFGALYIGIVTHVGAVVVIVFEHAITFDREVHFAWGRKPSWPRCIFLLNRYLSIVEYLVVLGPLLPTASTFVSVPGLATGQHDAY